MMRFARVVSCVVIGFVAFGARASAQTPAGTASSEPRFYAAIDFGATFGHKSSGFFGGEAGARITGPLAVFLEGGQMRNVGSQDLDDRAFLIANAVGATASASYRINYFDVGVRYTPDMAWKARPYVVFGVGLAEVRATTSLAINGTTVDPASLGVQFGNDLNGTARKPFITVGGGVTYPLMKRLFFDGSFRYGRVLPNEEEGASDSGINTQRLQFGIGFRF
jgi:opacity protein-like surface antigen